MALRDRIAKLEAHDRGVEMQIIVVTGGIPGDPRVAEAGEHSWVQMPDETDAAFHARAVGAASAVGATFIVVGGMP